MGLPYQDAFGHIILENNGFVLICGGLMNH